MSKYFSKLLFALFVSFMVFTTSNKLAKEAESAKTRKVRRNVGEYRCEHDNSRYVLEKSSTVCVILPEHDIMPYNDLLDVLVMRAFRDPRLQQENQVYILFEMLSQHLPRHKFWVAFFKEHFMYGYRNRMYLVNGKKLLVVTTLAV